MVRSRYKIYEPTHPYFVTCTILNWILIFTRQETVEIVFDSLKYIHHNPVKRGYIDEAKHWRYSSTKDYEGEKGLIDIERVWFA